MELKRGDTFTFRNSTWKVTESCEIKWNDGTVSKEFKVKSNAGLIRFLEIESDLQGKKTYSYWKKEYNTEFLVKGQDAKSDSIHENGLKFAKNFTYKGIRYDFDQRSSGMCQYDFFSGYQKEIVVSLDYSNNGNSKLLSIELWDDDVEGYDDAEVYLGEVIIESDIKNIEKKKWAISGSSILDLAYNYSTAIFIAFVVIFISFSRCNRKNSWGSGESSTQEDSTKVKRSNNSYRGRNTYGYGK